MTCFRRARPVSIRSITLALGLCVGVWVSHVGIKSASAQTFQATHAVNERECRELIGIFDKCVTIRTERIQRSFTEDKLGSKLFSQTWATASHCTSVDGEQKCRRSVAVSSDPAWDRIIWGRPEAFLQAYGQPYGQQEDWAGQFRSPRGVDITRREGEWQVAFVADALNNRVVFLALGYECRCVRLLWTINGSESGKTLIKPFDVAWDNDATWSPDDDRLFILDTGNDRVLVYRIFLNLATGAMSQFPQYLGSFGSTGQGADQLVDPQGITVRSKRIPICIPGHSCAELHTTDVYVSDTGNRRVVSWSLDPESGINPPSNPTPVSQSEVMPNAELVGISADHYGGVIVADRARHLLLKFKSTDLTLLKTYGGTTAWENGSFNYPTDTYVVPHYEVDADGQQIAEYLPYTKTTEWWSSSTGGQLHRLGVDVDELTATVPSVNGAREATVTFLLTGNGEYTISIRSSSGAIVRSWTAAADGGRKSRYWDGKDSSGTLVPYGTYTAEVSHRSGYTYDTIPRVTSTSFTFLSPFVVSASVPSYVTKKAYYTLSGSATHTATDWKWYQSWDNQSWSFLSNQQNVTWLASAGKYTVYWRLSARRGADGMTDEDYRQTQVCISSTGCDELPNARVADDPTASDLTSHAETEQLEIVAREMTPERLGDHYGAGAWVGARAGEAPHVIQLYSPSGNHESAASEWPNIFGGESAVVQRSADGSGTPFAATAAFTPVGGTNDERVYRIRFERTRAKASDFYVGLALDPDLGAAPEDDLLGVDTVAGLIWVSDPDSGALGYVFADLPKGARVTVRQFSNWEETRRRDPITDEKSYAELAARGSALTGRNDDVRFVISVGPVPFMSDVNLGMAVLRGRSLAELRERAGQLRDLALAPPDLEDGGLTGITEFRLTQAAPEPSVPPGVARVSLSVVPGLSSGRAPRLTPAASAELRTAVREHGITALAFAVPDGETARVTVRVYDSAGRLVRTLTDDTYDAGAYRVQWDLNDERGTRVAPGVYVAIMEAPRFRDMTKLVVVR